MLRLKPRSPGASTMMAALERARQFAPVIVSHRSRPLTPPFTLAAADGFIIARGQTPDELAAGAAALACGFFIIDATGIEVLRVAAAKEKTC